MVWWSVMRLRERSVTSRSSSLMRSMNSCHDGRPTLMERPAPANRMARRSAMAAASSSGMNCGNGSASHQNALLDATFLAEPAQVARDVLGPSDRLHRIVRELDGAPAVGVADLAHQRDGLEPVMGLRRAAVEIVGQVGAPAEARAHPAVEVAISLLDGVDVEPV